jgi:FKBP-type peptidyl-prolyl cis-trans isomerase
MASHQTFIPWYLTRPVILILLSALIFSCRPEAPRKAEIPASKLKEPLIRANQELVSTESEQIADFLRRYKWEVTETGSGLRYMVYRQGSGQQVLKGDEVYLAYTLTFLTGDTVYSSRDKGNLIFISGKAQVISGLEEGILLLCEGDRAKFIIPSHLAYGLIGDQDKIGSKATLVYDVELLKIKN